MSKYNLEYACAYAALWAYGSETLGIGGTEGFYRTVGSLAADAIMSQSDSGSLLIADVGCGVGRVIRDLALRFPAATFHGFDSSAEMIAVGLAVLRGSNPLHIDLSDRGLPSTHILPAGVTNAHLFVIDPDKPIECEMWAGACNVVMSVNTIERTRNPTEHLQLLAKMAAPDATILVASTLNWQTAALWSRFPTFSHLVDILIESFIPTTTLILERIPYEELLDAAGALERYSANIAVLRR